jgi:hypothetical protein
MELLIRKHVEISVLWLNKDRQQLHFTARDSKDAVAVFPQRLLHVQRTWHD